MMATSPEQGSRLAHGNNAKGAWLWLWFRRPDSAVRASNILNPRCWPCMSPQVVSGHSAIVSLGSGIADALS